MFKNILLTSFSIGILSLTVSPAFSRALEDWPYERLFKEADLVVIASAKATVAADDRLKEKPWKVEFLGLTTSLTVKTSLKGKPNDAPIRVLHYKLEKGVQIKNGPSLVSFRTRTMLITGKGGQAQLGPPEYLLFLKLRKDGRYEPVSGQIDPELSIREIYQALPDLSER